jgi:hypothetical protein
MHFSQDSHLIWKDLFVLVRSVTGPNFQGQSIAPQPLQATTQAMCEISQNPALHHANALDALRAQIYPIVIAWAANQCKDALGEDCPRQSSGHRRQSNESSEIC